MKKWTMFLIVILSLGLMTACGGIGNETNSNVSSTTESKQETVSSEEAASSDEEGNGESNSETPSNRVSAIVGGGDFDVGDDY